MSSLRTKSLLAGFLTGILSLPAALATVTAFPYYQIDFESPGSIPNGTPPSIPSASAFSSVQFGNIGTGPFPGTGSNAAVFNTTGNTGLCFYDQARLNFDQTGLIHRLSADVYLTHILGTENRFVIVFDTPQVQPIRFNPDGTISGFDYRIPALGSFEENKLLRIEAIGDTVTQMLTVTINGIPLASSPYRSDGGLLTTVRFSLGAITGDDPNDPSTVVYVDNIFASVPEPSSSVLALAALTILSSRRKRP